MPPRRQFYDPFVESPVSETPADMSHDEERVTGLQVEKPGLYLYVDDVVAILRRWAAENNNDELLTEAANGFASMVSSGPMLQDEPPPAVVADPHPEVARLEVYPDSDGRWHARPVGPDGSILAVTDGSFDRDFVERDAAERWPGKTLFELADAMGDSIWDEQESTFGFNGRRRPSPRRLWS